MVLCRKDERRRLRNYAFVANLSAQTEDEKCSLFSALQSVRATTRNGYMISCHLIGLRKTKTFLKPQKDKLRPREMAEVSRRKPLSKDTHDTMESFRTIDLSTLRTCGKFHRKVVFFSFLYWNYVTHRNSRTMSFNQQICLRLLRTM